jgi:hypothetical protein
MREWILSLTPLMVVIDLVVYPSHLGLVLSLVASVVR